MSRNEESEALKKRISELSNEELLNMVEVEPDEYRKEALDYAKAELMARGVRFQEAGDPSGDEADSISESRVLRKVMTCKNVAQAGLLKGLISGSGIDCEIRGEYLSMAAGELPFAECYPEIWVAGDENFRRAKEVVEEWYSSADSQHENWICQRCGEENEGQFGSCWSCGWAETGSNDQSRT